MATNLVCTIPIHGYVKGQVVSDPVTIEKLRVSHDAHFVAISVSEIPQQVVSTMAAAPSADPKTE